MAEVPLPAVNPFDNTRRLDFDLPAVGEMDDPIVEEMRGDQREQARIQKARGNALTQSRAFAIMAEFVAGEREKRLGVLLGTPITDKNKDELNFIRGEVSGLQMALRYAQAIADGAEATIELFREEDKLNAARAESAPGH